MQQRMIRRRRLILPYIQARASDLLRGQRRGQIVFVMDAATRRRNEIRMVLHRRELLRPHHPPRLGGVRTIDGDVVGNTQKILQRRHLFHALSGQLLRRLVRVIGNNTHLEQPTAQFRHPAPDMADADDANRAALDVIAHELDSLVVLAAAHRVIRHNDALR